MLVFFQNLDIFELYLRKTFVILTKALKTISVEKIFLSLWDYKLCIVNILVFVVLIYIKRKTILQNFSFKLRKNCPTTRIDWYIIWYFFGLFIVYSTQRFSHMHAVYRHHLISVGIDIPFNEVVKIFYALQMFCGQNELKNILFHLKKNLKNNFTC